MTVEGFMKTRSQVTKDVAPSVVDLFEFSLDHDRLLSGMYTLLCANLSEE